MKPSKYIHKSTEVDAIQVVSPYKDVTTFVPRSHPVKYPGGRLKHFHLVDAVGKTNAEPGDWILKFPDRRIEILTDEEFRRDFGD